MKMFTGDNQLLTAFGEYLHEAASAERGTRVAHLSCCVGVGGDAMYYHLYNPGGGRPATSDTDDVWHRRRSSNAAGM